MDTPAHRINVWLVEDDGRFRDAVGALLDRLPTTRLAGAHGSVAEALAAARNGALTGAPNIVLLDVGLPGLSGLDGLGALRAALPGARFVMLTVKDDAETVFGALERGASGYVVKGSPVGVLLRVVEEAHAGGMLLPPLVARRVQEHFTRGADGYGLTGREREVLALMVEGLVQKEIAERLFVSPTTINTHVRHLYEKLHVNTGTAAVSKAVRERLVGTAPAPPPAPNNGPER